MSLQRSTDSKIRFEKLFLDNYRELFQLGFGLSKRKGFTMDVIQGFFLEMIESRVWQKDIIDMKSYLFRSFYHKVIRELKNASVTSSLPEVEKEDLNGNFERAMEENQSRILLQSALEKATLELPPQQQKVLRLKYQEGMDYQEIAEITGRSSQTIYNQVHQAIGKLRKSMKGKK